MTKAQQYLTAWSVFERVVTDRQMGERRANGPAPDTEV
jgi:hypothetical protein